ncbi:MAG: carboxypeptidase-like regulatory domain-containing protein, partial [Terracidiphilus sp.]
MLFNCVSLSIPLRARFARCTAWLALPVLLAALALPACAQLDTGSIRGQVTDPAGDVVPHASIQAKQAATGAVYSTVTSRAGDYVLPSLHTGTYTVTASAKGFKTAVYTGIVVAIGTQVTQNAALAVGSPVETVTVSSASMQLETTTSEIDDTISPREVEELPLQVGGSLRSLSSLEFLVPGAVGPGTSSGGAGATQMSKINGGQEEGTDYL